MSQQASTLSANGQTTAITVNNGGRIFVVATGTFGSGTITLQGQDPDNAWQPLAAGITGSGQIAVELPKGETYSIRVDLTGATGPSIEVWVATEEN